MKEISKLAKAIKALRKKKKMSQDKLSKTADIAYNTLIKIESGAIKNPTIKTMKSLAKAFEVTIDELAKSI